MPKRIEILIHKPAQVRFCFIKWGSWKFESLYLLFTKYEFSQRLVYSYKLTIGQTSLSFLLVIFRLTFHGTKSLIQNFKSPVNWDLGVGATWECYGFGLRTWIWETFQITHSCLLYEIQVHKYWLKHSAKHVIKVQIWGMPSKSKFFMREIDMGKM